MRSSHLILAAALTLLAGYANATDFVFHMTDGSGVQGILAALTCDHAVNLGSCCTSPRKRNKLPVSRVREPSKKLNLQWQGLTEQD